jgi:hypothetical protein
VTANPIARNVKVADLHDSCDLSRFAQPTEEDMRRVEMYRAAIETIRSCI